ncbi:FAS1 domain-containing protein [Mycotypha africana]|uniref:FAS1 domain-containing protein n=1 Tax=Mycotypha africana TaxID=64632 RepID=UPI002300BA1C|nr:FAS1 domain-containing protein [Mycotypha africana]KAI8973486.1 FAS1 domain-containing protein [Mycotypha africana]
MKQLSLIPLVLIQLLLFTLVVRGYKTIIDVLSEDERFSTLITHLQHTRLIPYINNLEAGTFFAPDNAAFSKLKDDTFITRNILLYHLLPKQYATADFENGQILESSYVRPHFLGNDETGQRLKVTKRFNQFFHINDARIKDRDIFVNRNTTINVVDRVLEPPDILSNVLQKLDKKLFELLVRTGVDEVINQERPFTAFVSKKNILDKFQDIEQKYLTSKYGLDDLKHIVQYLVIPKAIFLNNHSIGETTYTSESGEKLTISVSKYGKDKVNEFQVLEKDILAANGVIHVLEDLPYANTLSFDTRKYLLGLNATKFVSLMNEFGLGKYIEKETQNVTILTPPNDVISEDDIPNSHKEQWLSYHVIEGVWNPSDLIDRMLLKTKYNAAELRNSPQRLQVRVSGHRVPDDYSMLSKPIYFGDHSRIITNNMSICGNVIYSISDPLTLPTDLITRLVIDLDFSTFIATLYVSGVVEEIKEAKAITLFAPTNEAFKSLGLVSRYLVHPAGKADLRRVLKYHIASSPLYYQDLLGDILEVTTLAGNETMFINGNNNDNNVWIGTTAAAGDNDQAIFEDERGVIQDYDYLISNGVVHKVDHLQIPASANITQYNILRGINANIMLNILEKTNLLHTADFKNSIVLAPTDNAFESINLEESWNDMDKLTKLAKLHIIPQSNGRKRWFLFPLFGDHIFDTMLSSQDKIVFRDLGYGVSIVRVKGKPYGTHARVLDTGRVSVGDRSGGVIEIDSVLLPIERGLFGLPWLWSFVILLFIWVVALSIIIVSSLIIYKKWKRNRDGYETILDSSEDTTNSSNNVENS